MALGLSACPQAYKADPIQTHPNKHSGLFRGQGAIWSKRKVEKKWGKESGRLWLDYAHDSVSFLIGEMKIIVNPLTRLRWDTVKGSDWHHSAFTTLQLFLHWSVGLSCFLLGCLDICFHNTGYFLNAISNLFFSLSKSIEKDGNRCINFHIQASWLTLICKSIFSCSK